MGKLSAHNEENFWPSVSDMFLSLFVIALFLFSTASKKRSDGDILFAEQTLTETKEFVSSLQDLPDAQRDQKLLSLHVPDKLSYENGIPTDQDSLANVLCSVLECPSLEPAFPLKDVIAEEGDRKDYRSAILLLYRASASSIEEMEPTDDAVTPDAQLRQVRHRIIDKMKRQGEMPEDVDDLKARIKKQREEIDTLKARTQKRQEEIDSLKAHTQKWQEEMENLRREKDTLSSDLNRLALSLSRDPRVEVMSGVQKLLPDSLKDAVELESDLGVIRIPSSSVSFPSGGTKISQGADVLREVASLLLSIVRHDENATLVDGQSHPLIDNIVFECHADSDGSLEVNERISSARALEIWEKLDEFSGYQFNGEKNEKGLGLFSHAGFGYRVPLEKRPGEDSEQYKARCRRIDIRFNCSPLKDLK
jgi:flagellar motor protein MotB